MKNITEKLKRSAGIRKILRNIIQISSTNQNILLSTERQEPQFNFWSLMSRGRGWRCPCGNQSRQAACACAATSPRDSTQPLAAIWGTSWYSLVLLSTFWYFLVLLGASWYWVLSVLWGDSTQALASNQPEPPLKCCYCAFLLIRLDILPVTVQLNFSHLSAVHNCTLYTVCLCLCLCCVFVCLCLRVCVFVSLCCTHMLYHVHDQLFSSVSAIWRTGWLLLIHDL